MVLGNSEAQKMPMDRDFVDPAALTGPMNRKFGARWGLLGGLRSTDRADESCVRSSLGASWNSAAPTRPMERGLRGRQGR